MAGYNIQPKSEVGIHTYSTVNIATSQDAANISATPCNVYGIDIFNNSTNPIYLKVYDKATTPSSGDTPKRRYMVPAGGGLVRLFTNGLSMASGLGIRLTGAISDGDTTNVAASTAVINVDYF